MTGQNLQLLPTKDELTYITELLRPLSWQSGADAARFCVVCGARMSRYNPGDTCWHHDLQPKDLLYGAHCSRHHDCFTCPKKDCIAHVDSRKNHQYGHRNESIRRLRAAGQQVGDIASLFGLSDTSIRHIVARGNGSTMRVRP